MTYSQFQDTPRYPTKQVRITESIRIRRSDCLEVTQQFGILAEVASPAPVVVVGLGLNVTMTTDEAPDPRATSLTQLGAGTVDRNPLAQALLRHLAARFAGWRNADPGLAADYRARSVTIGSRVRAILPGDNALVGTAADVDELGRLIIDTGAERATVSAGDITHLRPDEP